MSHEATDALSWSRPKIFENFKSWDEVERSLWFQDPTKLKGYVVTYETPGTGHTGKKIERTVVYSPSYKAFKRIVRTQSNANTEPMILLVCHKMDTDLFVSHFPHLT